MVGGERADTDLFARFTIGIEGLIDAARAGVSEETPVPAFGLLGGGDLLYIGAASVLTDYDYSGEATINMPTGSVLVLTRALDSNLLAEIGGHYLLDDLRLVLEATPPGAPALPLLSVGSEAAGYLAWRTELPGRQILEWVIPALVAALLGLTALTFLFLARTERAVQHLVSQDQLIATEKKLRRHESELTHMARVTTMGEMASTLAHELKPAADLDRQLRRRVDVATAPRGGHGQWRNRRGASAHLRPGGSGERDDNPHRQIRVQVGRRHRAY